MQTCTDQNDIYLKPSRQSKTSKYIDIFVISNFVALMILTPLLIIDTDYSLGLNLSKYTALIGIKFFWGYSAAVIALALMNGTIHRFSTLNKKEVLELMRELKGEKVKRNISLLITVDGKITKCDLRALAIQMELNLVRLQNKGYEEMAKISDLSDETKKAIYLIEQDLLVLNQFFKKG